MYVQISLPIILLKKNLLVSENKPGPIRITVQTQASLKKTSEGFEVSVHLFRRSYHFIY